MKKLILSLAALAVLCASLPTVAQADPVKLTYSNFFPPANHQSQLAEEWCREVEKRTGGKVVIDYYPGGTLTQAKQTYDGVVEGMSDIGLSCLAYTRGRFPVMAAVDLPLGYKTAAQATHTANAVYQHFKPEELADVEVMYFNGHGPGLLFTTTKPVATLEDIKGQKIRSTGNSAQLVQALGGTPVAKPMPENYQLLQKGVVDGSMHPIESNKSFKLGEVCKFGTDCFDVAYTTVFFIVMNKAKWASLDADSQKAIREINAEWAPKHAKAWDEADIEGRQYLIDQGGKIMELSPEESARWVAASQPVIEGYIKETDARGLDGKAIIEFTRSTLK
ncbi:MAG: TRAP transporter substrate-binding protein [Pseudodesulfovibrio sp.]|uniref:Extracellular solute-binding protein, family 7 n=1 Tax=Pseudodesulfovibrio aespoeensis (strain ATCC 700646 / DSM 10631 / Aspo-2) TaxID=643562 RepID=E6VYM7_PSEA9|nr:MULTISPECIES: TRAP transporter substrate-binding protein [Pseudodesulfovibrio]MBU4192930.1 TRAP transporter substrate-binding protein [Pseudomonadota bacterium]ADU63894.1 Extracellular solute-binding protein, family 7 [Pseudodesulfovibrio aespoeensis Aspo-2]MBU4243573.1 TRAP transporter substrate-binding protein [Pseudomonadota bacterium]MBU4378228.1 TRAP transporter substrate-binding protein [Pseudomonadota bacterium]MBU4475439.1 TRAP transporter substrate-binding protein [Pseudomonadota b